MNTTDKIAKIDKAADKEKEKVFNLINLIVVLSDINLNTDLIS